MFLRFTEMQLLRRGSSRKTDIEGGDCLKRGSLDSLQIEGVGLFDGGGGGG